MILPCFNSIAQRIEDSNISHLKIKYPSNKKISDNRKSKIHKNFYTFTRQDTFHSKIDSQFIFEPRFSLVLDHSLTNQEYQQFIHYVEDSIIRERIYNQYQVGKKKIDEYYDLDYHFNASQFLLKNKLDSPIIQDPDMVYTSWFINYELAAKKRSSNDTTALDFIIKKEINVCLSDTFWSQQRHLAPHLKALLNLTYDHHPYFYAYPNFQIDSTQYQAFIRWIDSQNCKYNNTGLIPYKAPSYFIDYLFKSDSSTTQIDITIPLKKWFPGQAEMKAYITWCYQQNFDQLTFLEHQKYFNLLTENTSQPIITWDTSIDKKLSLDDIFSSYDHLLGFMYWRHTFHPEYPINKLYIPSKEEFNNGLSSKYFMHDIELTGERRHYVLW